jgi:hypothetical protein
MSSVSAPFYWTAVLLGTAFAVAAQAAEKPDTLLLNARPVHLRSGATAEWDEFSSRIPAGRRLDLRFHATTNTEPATLLIRQEDVRQDWAVELNGQRLGKLFLMEADLIHALNVPAGRLQDGTNVLSIVPPKDNDDIVLHEIRLVRSSLTQTIAGVTLQVTVVDAKSRQLLPARVTIVEPSGALAPLLAATNAVTEESPADSRSGPEVAPPMAVRPGVVYTGRGRARVSLPAGDYTVYASRGFEWSVVTQQVHFGASPARHVTLELRREVPTPGLVSCDTHVHTFTHSGHGDATIEERMLTLAGEGIELPIATDHNYFTDYAEPARRMGVTNYFTPVTGNEVTTIQGHFNIFPSESGARVPDFHLTNWPALMKELRATPGCRVVVLNHPRNVHNQFQPFAATNYNNLTGENRRGPEFSFDAIELLNSSAQQTDYLLVYRDWFALLNHGYRITGVGSSDGHDVSRYIVGQGRTYIECPDVDPGHLDVDLACSNLVAGRALVSMGLLVQLTVNGRFSAGDLAAVTNETMEVKVRVLGPSWVKATNVIVFANGLKIRESAIYEPGASATPLSQGEKAVTSWTMPRPRHDVHLVALATGPGISAPFWAIPRPYQPVSPSWESRVVGSTNPIWIDADSDGKFTSAREYARQLVERHRSEPAQLLAALGAFDEAVAAQAASLWTAAGGLLDDPTFARELNAAPPQVQSGFRAFAATMLQ